MPASASQQNWPGDASLRPSSPIVEEWLARTVSKRTQLAGLRLHDIIDPVTQYTGSASEVPPSSARLTPKALTKASLRKHNRSMRQLQDINDDDPVSPTRSFTTTTPTHGRMIETAPSTGNGSVNKKSPRIVQRNMRKHGLLQDDKEALLRYPQFEKTMRDIITQERLSSMKPSQWMEFSEKRSRIQHRNEQSLLQTLIPLVIRRKYTVAKILEGTRLDEYNRLKENVPEGSWEEHALKKEYLYTTKLWFDDGLGVNIDADFLGSSLPNIFLEKGFSAHEARRRAKSAGLTTPKPDFCYGIDAETIRDPDDIIEDTDIMDNLEISPGLFFPFFLIEGKSSGGNMLEAQNQASRGGSAIIRTLRNLYQIADYPPIEEPGVDSKTAIFSATMNQDIVHIWLHWAEIQTGGRVRYHMHNLVTKVLTMADHVQDLRKICHNILNWGCNTRRGAFMELHRRLVAVQRAREDNESAQFRASLGPNHCGEQQRIADVSADIASPMSRKQKRRRGREEDEKVAMKHQTSQGKKRKAV